MYNVGTYIALFGVILVTVIFFTTILSLVSTLAKNVKESSQWSSVIMILVMMLGVTSLIGMGDIPSAPYLYLIPVYNSVLCMSSIFSLSVNILNFIITILSNVLYISLGVYLLAKMFNSEKIMSNI
jgi:sodium transport system permease protein